MIKVFISHASEDKREFVRPLAKKLMDKGLDVWYDEFSLKLGDSLRQSIELGISEASYGIVVLSPNFIKKSWTQSELNGLFSKEIAGKCKILPLWFNIDHSDILKHFPILADKVASVFDGDFEVVVNKILETIFDEKYSKDFVVSLANQIKYGTVYERKLKYSELALRIDQYFGYICECSIETAKIPLEGEMDEEKDQAYHNSVVQVRKNLAEKYQIPEGIWFDSDFAKVSLNYFSELKKIGKRWLNGKMSLVEVKDLYFRLYELDDIDVHYIFWGIPLYLNPSADLMGELFVKIGANEYKKE